MNRHIQGVCQIAIILAALSPMAFGQDDDTENKDTTVTSGSIIIQIRDGIEIEGTPVGVESVSVNSLFGEAKIPIHTIAGIHFGDNDKSESTIVLLNGDALTGEITLSEMACIADWGEAKINVQSIESIVFRRDLKWSSIDTPNGRRWQLKKVTRQQVIPSQPMNQTNYGYPSYSQ